MIPANFSSISFPFLGIEVNPGRIFQIGPLTVHYYGLIIAIGLVLAVCSAADLRKVKYNIQAIGVDESIFTALVTGSDVERKKPFPDIYLEGARRVGIDPKDCLVVEDAVSGIQAAHAAGMDAVGVPTTFSKEELTARVHPEYLLNEIKELTDLFN